jgi:hypothetical protein
MDEDAPHQMRWPCVIARLAGYLVLAVVLYFLGLAPMGYLLSARAPAVDRALNVCGRVLAMGFTL